MVSELETQIEKVREARQASGYYSGLVNLALQKFELDHAALIADMNIQKARVSVEEAKLRDLTLTAYAETGNKKPAPGVGIRIVKEISCDESKAITWAVEAKALNCLSLQKTNFKKVAEGLALPFVDIKEVATATISKEL